MSRPPQVPWHRSLGAKVFLLVSVCTTAAIVLIAWRNGQFFSRHLERQIATHTLDEARGAAEEIDHALEGWTAIAATAVRTIADDADPARQAAALRRLLNSSREFVALGVYAGTAEEVFAAANDTQDLRLEDRSHAKTVAQIRASNSSWVRRLQQSAPQQVRLKSLARDTTLPLLSIAWRFDTDTGRHLWTVLTVWQSRIAAALPAGATVRSALVDRSLAAENALVQMVPGPEQAVADEERRVLGEVAADGNITGGFRKLRDAAGLERGAAVARLKYPDLAVFVSRDARPGLVAIRSQVVQTALWAWTIFLGSMLVSYLSVAGVTRNLRQVTEAALQIAAGDLSVRLALRSGDEIGLLSRVVNFMTEQIAALLRATAAAVRQEKELETARAVQDLLYPASDSERSDLAISGTCLMASECGGDWWGHFSTADGREFILIADVLGHGAPAALVTSMIFTTRMLLEEQLRNSTDDFEIIRRTFESINHLLWRASGGDVTATAFAAVVDPATGLVRYGNAGHPRPYIVPASRDDPRLGESKLKRPPSVYGRGTPLGFDPRTDFGAGETRLEPGDRLLLYSDGLVECVNQGAVPWRRRSLERVLLESTEASAAALRDGVIAAATRHFAGQPLDDDVTVVVVERRSRGLLGASDPQVA